MFRRLLSLFGRKPVDLDGPQYGALPYVIVDGHLVVLLVTSRGRGKWIFPKGRLMEGKTPWETAAIEAWEEAGVEGEIETTPIGRYYLPVTPERPRPVEVEIFPMLVTGQREDWKESGQRHRHWAVLPEARRLITHEGLADVAVALGQREAKAGRVSEGVPSRTLPGLPQGAKA
ncbi:NUDIX hydrolase [Pelagibacterium sp. H642]|uniref:NUDIX hydrolase n=1 Tax=Pelagibacterium sp. H642 TaxID=1881069 RepID=UPI00281547C2|nr:NUDIX hydrolase [Pelagibacterium sp. H642]WMT91644.1 NUDIX hydrolase [Pelagibacterium sp. H642]